MILSISNTKRIVLLFSIFHFLFSTPLQAQTTTGIDPNNLSSVRIDELSDAQVMSIVKQGEASGLTIEQAQAMAAKRGLPTSEVQKLKDRVAKIQGGGAKSAETAKGAESTETEIATKVIEKAAEATTLTGKIQDAGGVAKGTGNTIYGQEYFRNGDIKIYDKSTDAKAPANYIIGIGDEFGISVFGYSYYNEVLKVDARGAINPNQMGPIFIKGLTFERAKSLIRSKMGQYFDLSNNKLEITLAYSRSITVNIVGEVVKPGSYKLPAINTAFNALILAGGPNDIGTLRAIEIRRDGKTVRSLDVYAFLNDPKSTQDFYLEDNDYIVVSAAKKIVNIKGEVKRNSLFELLEKESLTDLIKYAGGLNANAYTGKIQIRRNSTTEIKIIDVNYDSLLKNKKIFNLFNGDEISIRSTLTELKNVITINGAVNFPGEYSYKNNIRVLDLIKNAGGIKEEAYLNTAYLVRTNDDLSKKYIEVNLAVAMQNANSEENILLEKRDLIRIYSSREYVDPFTISVSGAVRKPQTFDYAEGARLQEAIRYSEGLRVDADLQNAYIIRTNDDDSKIYLRVNLNDALKDKISNQNILLQPRDQIKIYSLKDNIRESTIKVFGAIRNPGDYDFVPGLTLGDVLKNAGGLNIEAENLRIEVSRLNYFSENYVDGQDIRVTVEKIRLNANNFNLTETEAQLKLQPFDQIFVRTVPNFETQQNITLRGEVKYPGVYSLLNKDERIDDVIKRAGGLTKFAFSESATLFRPSLTGGYIVMNMKRALKSHRNKYNYALRVGDTLTIPTVNDYVGIRGSSVEYLSILNKEQVNAPYVKNRRAKYYINDFGNGFSKDSWRKKTYVVQPNAKVNRTRDFLVFKIYPKVTKGSTIYVVEKIKKDKELKKEREPFNWNKFVENTTLKVTGVATFFVLLNQIKL